MKYKNLGNTNEKVAVVGQGCMGIGGYLFKDNSEEKEQIKALRLGIELGTNFIDTAEDYGAGHSEEIVGRAIEGMRDKVFIATKVSQKYLSYNDVLRSAEGSLKRLKTDYIDLYQIHWPNPAIPIEETMRAMEKLLSQGKIRYVGVSNFSLRELKEVKNALSGSQIVSMQAEYSPLDRTIEEDILPFCESEKITTIAYSPLGKGKLSGKENGGSKKIEELQKIAVKYNKSVVQIILNWLVAHPSVIAIPQATNPVFIKENAASPDFELEKKDFTAINELFVQKCIYVPTNRIRVISTQGKDSRQAYQTVKEAMENKLQFIPSPCDLAQSFKKEKRIKPVHLAPSADNSGKYDYDLKEGRIRYWAWVIAYNGNKSIPAYITED